MKSVGDATGESSKGLETGSGLGDEAKVEGGMDQLVSSWMVGGNREGRLASVLSCLVW